MFSFSIYCKHKKWFENDLSCYSSHFSSKFHKIHTFKKYLWFKDWYNFSSYKPESRSSAKGEQVSYKIASCKKGNFTTQKSIWTRDLNVSAKSLRPELRGQKCLLLVKSDRQKGLIHIFISIFFWNNWISQSDDKKKPWDYTIRFNEVQYICSTVYYISILLS